MHEGLAPDWQIDDAVLLGSGGEADVYGLDEHLVVRLYRNASSSTIDAANRRHRLCRDIADGAVNLPFATPVIVGQGRHNDRYYQIEERIPGTSLLETLRTADDSFRRDLIIDYLEVALQVGDIRLDHTHLGEIGRDDAVVTDSWPDYLAERARRSLNSSPLRHLSAEAISRNVPDLVGEPCVVHLDYFAGNVMAHDGRISGVIDFGYSTIIGDRRMNALVAVAFLTSPRISPTVTEQDRAVAFEWLGENDLVEYYEAALAWLAGYWTFAHEDESALGWCRSILE